MVTRGHTSILLIRQFIKIAFIHADSHDDCFLAWSGSIIGVSLLAQTLAHTGMHMHAHREGWIWRCKGFEDKEGNRKAGKRGRKIILIVQQWTPSRRLPLQSHSVPRNSHRTRVRQLMNCPSALQCTLVVVLVV